MGLPAQPECRNYPIDGRRVLYRALPRDTAHRGRPLYPGKVAPTKFGRLFIRLLFASVANVGRFRDRGSLTLLSDMSADAVPDLILKGNQRRGRQRRRWFRALDAVDDKTGDVDFSVCIIGITFAIPGEKGRSHSGNLEEGVDHFRSAQITHQQVAFGIGIWSDVVGDLPCIVA